MKLEIETPNIERSTEFQELQFGIAKNSVVFDILRSKMYSNPIATICQEIPSNARDAHREVGNNDTPIEISLPTHLDPNYRVRDFGPGISPDRMKNVFVLYGSSTKRDDNVQTGGFGIGAKTPWAYSDTFTIITIVPEKEFTDDKEVKHQNVFVKREYLAYIDETRIGKLALGHSSVTTEKQGTTIVIPVKRGDELSFITNTIKATDFWDIRPKILGDNVIFPKRIIKYHAKDNSWFMLDANELGYDDKYVRAIVDGICFSVNTDSLDGRGGLGNAEQLLHHPICMRFKTGEIPLTANREEIDYAKKSTSKLIVDKIKSVYDDIIKMIEDKISNAPNLWEANVTFKTASNQFSNLIKKTTWKGIDVSGDHISYTKYGAQQFVFTKSYLGIKCKSCSPFYFSEDSKLLIDDNIDNKLRPCRNRILSVFDKNPQLNIVYLVRFPIAIIDKEAFVKDPKKEQERLDAVNKNIKYIKEDTDKMGAKLLSSYEKMIIPKGKGYTKTVIQAYEWAGHHFVPTDVDLDEAEGYFVEVERRQPLLKDGLKCNFHNVFNDLKIKTGGNLLKVYGIPTRFLNKVGDDLEHFEDLIKERIEEIKSDPNFQKIIDPQIVNHTIKKAYNYIGQIIPDKKLMALIEDKNGIFCQYIDASAEAEKELGTSSKLRDLCATYSIAHKDQQIETKNLEKLQKDFEKTYPILVNLNCNITSVKKDELAFYINVCDAKEAKTLKLK